MSKEEIQAAIRLKKIEVVAAQKIVETKRYELGQLNLDLQDAILQETE